MSFDMERAKRVLRGPEFQGLHEELTSALDEIERLRGDALDRSVSFVTHQDILEMHSRQLREKDAEIVRLKNDLADKERDRATLQRDLESVVRDTIVVRGILNAENPSSDNTEDIARRRMAERARLKDSIIDLEREAQDNRLRRDANLAQDNRAKDAAIVALTAERDRLRDKRRFDAACAAMAGMLGRDEPYTNSALCGKFSVEFADALLKAMEDDIKHGNQGTVDALREKLAALRRVMGGS